MYMFFYYTNNFPESFKFFFCYPEFSLFVFIYLYHSGIVYIPVVFINIHLSGIFFLSSFPEFFLSYFPHTNKTFRIWFYLLYSYYSGIVLFIPVVFMHIHLSGIFFSLTFSGIFFSPTFQTPIKLSGILPTYNIYVIINTSIITNHFQPTKKIN